MTAIFTAAGPQCPDCGHGIGCWLAMDDSPCRCNRAPTPHEDLATKLAARAAHHRRKAAQDSPLTPLGWALQEHYRHTGAAEALEGACRELAEIVEGKLS